MTHEVSIFTKFLKDCTKFVEILLVANFWTVPFFLSQTLVSNKPGSYLISGGGSDQTVATRHRRETSEAKYLIFCRYIGLVSCRMIPVLRVKKRRSSSINWVVTYVSIMYKIDKIVKITFFWDHEIFSFHKSLTKLQHFHHRLKISLQRDWTGCSGLSCRTRLIFLASTNAKQCQN